MRQMNAAAKALDVENTQADAGKLEKTRMFWPYVECSQGVGRTVECISGKIMLQVEDGLVQLRLQRFHSGI